MDEHSLSPSLPAEEEKLSKRSKSLTEQFFSSSPERVATVSDSDAARRWAEKNGSDFLHISAALDNPPPRAILICTTKWWYSRLSFIREALKSSAVLWIPLAAFDGEDDVVSYGLAQLDEVDWNAVTSQKETVADLIDRTRQYELSDDRGNNLNVKISAETTFQRGSLAVLKSGEFRSLVGSLEVETEYIEEGSTIDANGVLRVDSLLYALGPRTQMDEHERVLAEDLTLQVGKARETLIEVTGSSVKSFTVDGVERIQDLVTLAGKQHSDKITEFSFGLNGSLSDPDWSLNSPFNEGSTGIHLGMGDGYTGVHLDYICASTTIR